MLKLFQFKNKCSLTSKAENYYHQLEHMPRSLKGHACNTFAENGDSFVLLCFGSSDGKSCIK